MAATQRPVAGAAFGEPNGTPAWRTLPSWAVVATGDKAAGSDVVRSMAERANATIVEVEGSHVIMISQPRRRDRRDSSGDRCRPLSSPVTMRRDRRDVAAEPERADHRPGSP